MSLPLVDPWRAAWSPSRASPASSRVGHAACGQRASRPGAHCLHVRLVPHHRHAGGMPEASHSVLRHHPPLLVLVLLMVHLVLELVLLVGVPRAQGRKLRVVGQHWGVQRLRYCAVRCLARILHHSEAGVEAL